MNVTSCGVQQEAPKSSCRSVSIFHNFQTLLRGLDAGRYHPSFPIENDPPQSEGAGARARARMTLCVVALLVALAMAAGRGASAELVGPSPSEPLPVVLWHGMGDTCCNPKSMGRVKDLIQQEIGAYVVSIRLGATEEEDQRAGFFGLVPVQIAHVCHELASDSRLSAGFNAVGFSQGGQFLRAVVQVCPTLVPNFPRTSALVTLGGQHQGVMDWPGCGDAASTALCRSLQALLAFGAYSDFLQRRVVQAQYFKDPRKMDEYLQKNVFLPDINNEKALNEDYKRNLARLDLLMLLMWKNDTTVVPRESSLFGVSPSDLLLARSPSRF